MTYQIPKSTLVASLFVAPAFSLLMALVGLVEAAASVVWVYLLSVSLVAVGGTLAGRLFVRRVVLPSAATESKPSRWKLAVSGGLMTVAVILGPQIARASEGGEPLLAVAIIAVMMSFFGMGLEHRRARLPDRA